jgi:hypothetical protein
LPAYSWDITERIKTNVIIDGSGVDFVTQNSIQKTRQQKAPLCGSTDYLHETTTSEEKRNTSAAKPGGCGYRTTTIILIKKQ